MTKFRIEKFNGRNFILKAVAVQKKKDTWAIWYKEDKFLRRWIFIGYTSDIRMIMQTIHYYFGYTSIVHRIS